MCCPENGVGVTVNCNSNCNKWCPRVLRVFCCCFGCTDQVEASECDERVAHAVAEAVKEVEEAHHPHRNKKKVKKKVSFKKTATVIPT